MKPSEIFLLMLKNAGGRISGKTLVQKKAYFLNLFLNLGLNYRPHFYGPYSPELDATIGHCKALGFVEQKTFAFGFDRDTGFEIRRFDYILTPDGEVVAEDIIKKKPQECSKIFECLSKISQAGENDYMSLSIAAKTVHILRESNRPLLLKDIISEAKSFGWDISRSNIDKAITFLQELGLLEKGH